MTDVWFPSNEIIDQAQATKLARQIGLSDYDALYNFSVAQPHAYWQHVIHFLGIKWRKAPASYVDLSE